ncbi:MAG: hypothetical protein HZB59_11165 [Ignavibacteriales bacterium]|nr:hypothetical protein [Ignavibacteriales bacterium]
MEKSNSIAILVIHGIGEQDPFETLENFTGKFWDELKSYYPQMAQRGINKVKARDKWTQNYISLNTGVEYPSTVDIYEYFWAYKPQGKVKFNEVVEWLVKTSLGAGKFYKQYFNEHPEKRKKYKEAAPDMFKGDDFVKYGYLQYIGWAIRILSWLVSFMPTNLKWLISPPLKWFEQKAIDYLGDVVVYTTTDMKSPYFATRSEILYGAVEEIKTLMLDERYNKIVVVGHSLGSVIAYDALNRINHALNLGTIKPKPIGTITGLVTFGSPLDKVAFFFSEITHEEEELRRQILAHYHSFRILPIDKSKMRHQLEESFKPMLKDVQWINYWHPNDKVSGPLDFYLVDDNIEVEEKDWTVSHAHNNYWKYGKMYKDIVERFFI